MAYTFLSIECASELCSVALFKGGEVFQCEKLAAKEHAYLILPFTESLLSQSELRFADLEAIYFGRGPGAFTGLRVAAAMAQGLALANQIELKSVCSLGNLAPYALSSFNLKQDDSVVAVLDARMGELYWCAYQYMGSKLIQISAPELSSVGKLVSHLELERRSAYFLGPGCRHLTQKLNNQNCLNFASLNQDAELFPHACNALHQIEQARVYSGYEALAPLYLRNNIAVKAGE